MASNVASGHWPFATLKALTTTRVFVGVEPSERSCRSSDGEKGSWTFNRVGRSENARPVISQTPASIRSAISSAVIEHSIPFAIARAFACFTRIEARPLTEALHRRCLVRCCPRRSDAVAPRERALELVELTRTLDAFCRAFADALGVLFF